MTKLATKSIFSIDGVGEFHGYTFGQTWNGFACPYFELSAALKIAESYPLVVSYDAIKGVFKLDEGYLPEDVYEVSAQIINTVDGPKNVYSIGSFGWVWEDAAWHNA